MHKTCWEKGRISGQVFLDELGGDGSALWNWRRKNGVLKRGKEFVSPADLKDWGPLYDAQKSGLATR